MSPGTKNLLSEVLAWGATAVVCALVLANFEDFKAVTTGLIKPHITSELAAVEDGQRAQPGYRGESVRLSASRNGHFYAPVDVNGREINVMVDTGASMVALTYEDAQRAGLYLSPADFTARSRTANGIARAAPVVIDEIEIGGIKLQNVKGSVAEPGKLHITLLGMSFLGRLGKFEMRRGELILEQ